MKLKMSILALLSILTFTESALSSIALNFEFGQAVNAYNKARIDGENGTLFNLASALDSTSYQRLSFIKKFKSPSGFRLLYAPLKFSGNKRYTNDINFNGVNFLGGEETQVDYMFNSYRATYFYEFLSKRNLMMRLGGTLKVRDALVELKQSDRNKFKKKIGVVPLLYFYSQYKSPDGFLMTFDFDGLMAPQGRAFDFALMGGYQFSRSLSLHLGTRMLEGGADNERVYNFSQINYYFTTLQIVFY
jgi:hypothetical protein